MFFFRWRRKTNNWEDITNRQLPIRWHLLAKRKQPSSWLNSLLAFYRQVNENVISHLRLNSRRGMTGRGGQRRRSDVWKLKERAANEDRSVDNILCPGQSFANFRLSSGAQIEIDPFSVASSIYFIPLLTKSVRADIGTPGSVNTSLNIFLNKQLLDFNVYRLFVWLKYLRVWLRRSRGVNFSNQLHALESMPTAERTDGIGEGGGEENPIYRKSNGQARKHAHPIA